jgi:hypothetical protein
LEGKYKYSHLFDIIEHVKVGIPDTYYVLPEIIHGMPGK